MRTETSHFWFGQFTSEEAYFDFLGENETYYEDEDVIEDEKYISEFAKSQNENFLDHDFMESGFENEEVSFKEKFSPYSYSEKWITEAKERLVKQNQDPEKVNTVVFISKDQIEKPISIQNSKFELIYIGQIEYEI
ncbi:immunity 22 family protein [Flavobacterium sp. JAS]|uniref:immunity 22 family protein n=1 Tax=Flavobacterium sp. JAS TaxID=2897329 RepID=UPI001E28C8FB|nr:immunity 22 family protein [Flavobacterium sp. JAS]MCD0468121.1 immunity 22 family protein [Flavobacterium sp. JAS]